ncbi:MAG: DNA mismatch repair protein MutS [Bradymonadia bacterium]|jgi:DNA mismatch repair protein MutS
MMEQYFAAKAEFPGCIVLFRMGDFYEVFYDDAETLARELDLNLTARGKDTDNVVPMAGVPHHAVDGYVRRLIEKGFHVAMCDQLESPTKGKIVRRGVTRVMTPGMLLADDLLEADANNFLVALAVASLKSADVVALAVTDISTGELRVCETQSQEALATELRRLRPSEVLVAREQEALFRQLVEASDAVLTLRDDAAAKLPRVIKQASSSVLAVSDNAQRAATLTSRQLEERLQGLESFGFRDRAGVDAALALVLDYIMRTQGGVPATLIEPTAYRTDEYLVLDPASAANLEIFETLMGGKKSGSLFTTLNQCVTSAGARRLRTWVSYPLTSVDAIQVRQDAVSELCTREQMRGELRELFGATSDVQRIAGKLAAGQGNARDLVALRRTLVVLPKVLEVLAGTESSRLSDVRRKLDPCGDLEALIGDAIVDDPPLALNEGNIICGGYSAELDRLITLTTDGKAWLLNYERTLREETGITSLKVRYNRVFGYYIEVTRANMDQVPETFIRKQTLANAERFFTPELKEYEEEIVDARERRFALEAKIFAQVRGAVTDEVARLRHVAEQLAELDALAGLSELSVRFGYVAPTVTDVPGIHISDGRHPVVERMVASGRFVPNDVSIDGDSRLQIITGPNMAGKSTVIRQVALISLLAQIGSHVPARSATIGVIDQIFSRVGASDNLARGQSTFMVEMAETAHILKNATSRSLIVLDEIGRGTATYDGLSIAWSVAEFLHDKVEAFTLFATHYHELTEFVRVRDSARNLNIAVREWNDEIVFLHKLIDGPANRSYGIQVARLAGVPDVVVERAREILLNLESTQQNDAERDPALARERVDGVPVVRPKAQLHLFEETPAARLPTISALERELAEVPLERMSPIEALTTLDGLRKRARKAIGSDVRKP